ncbi:hypothetical protein OAK85_04145 [Mariniblastus sp.]|nr:hypothetical protein [Mariniblastus sp.]MDC0284526.1 hypothetical protein [Mariniblastus sp.]|eukprot:COSAG01_NODE_5044_length_4528_cov_3.407541_3_plen_299_part_00
MDFSKTFISIRTRSAFQIYDLAILVCVEYFKPLIGLLAIGAFPFILLDCWLIGWLATDYKDFRFFYWVMFLLVVSQAQIATTFMTHYLGQAMFFGRPKISTTVKEVLRAGFYFHWLHGGVRMVVPVLICCFFLSRSIELGAADRYLYLFLYLPGLVAFGLAFRMFRPFVSEILLLEKTPLRSKNETVVCFQRRSTSLHYRQGAVDWLFGQGVVSLLLGLFLGLAFYAGLLQLDKILNIQANSEWSYAAWYWLVALWLSVGFLCVARFLFYIDTRIRQEGWGVELRMRSESRRISEIVT